MWRGGNSRNSQIIHPSAFHCAIITVEILKKTRCRFMPKKVLIVEDDANIAELLHLYL